MPKAEIRLRALCKLETNGRLESSCHPLRPVRNPKKYNVLRIEAARAIAPYLQPKLSAVEMTQHDPADTYTDAVLAAMTNDLLHESPGLKQIMLNNLLHAHHELKEKTRYRRSSG